MLRIIRSLIKKIIKSILFVLLDFLGIYKLIQKISRHLASNKLNSLNWHKTLLANFTFFHWKDALRFPIIIYGPIDIGGMQGKIIIHCPVKKGLISIGRIGLYRRPLGERSYLRVDGEWHITGPAYIGRGVRISVLEGATFKTGEHVRIPQNSDILALERIEIGNRTSIGFNTVISDTDFHFMVHTETGLIKPRTLPVIIGNYTWLTSYSHVKKGTRTPEYFTLAGPNSMINKDYTKLDLPPYPLFAGSPAKLISHGLRRVYTMRSERELAKHFENSKQNFVVDDLSRLDELCFDGSYFDPKN